MVMGSQLFVEMDDEKKQKLKIMAVTKGHKIKEVINAAVDDYLEKDGEPKWLKE